jgi:hypothetical protein
MFMPAAVGILKTQSWSVESTSLLTEQWRLSQHSMITSSPPHLSHSCCYVDTAAASHLLAPNLWTPSHKAHPTATTTIVGAASFNKMPPIFLFICSLPFVLRNGWSGTSTSRNLRHKLCSITSTHSVVTYSLDDYSSPSMCPWYTSHRGHTITTLAMKLQNTCSLVSSEGATAIVVFSHCTVLPWWQRML